MRHITYILIGLIFLSCKTQTEREQIHKVYFADQIWKDGGYTKIDQMTFDMDNDNIPDTIKIYNIPDWTDPGDFQKLEFKLSNNDFYEIYNLGDWSNLDNFQIDKLKDINKFSSNKFIITDISDTKTIMIIFGWTYASSPGRLTIIDLTNGEIKILYDNQFKLKAIEDLDNDGIKDLIGLRYFGEGYYIDSISEGSSYCPYNVLKLTGDTLITDIELSEKYNIKHKGAFFGLDYDPDGRYIRVYPKIDKQFEPYYQFEKYRKYPETSLRLLTNDELEKFSKSDLRIMRNEIFAFHGYKFKSDDLNDYFTKQDWYKPKDKDVTDRLNRFEKENIKLIKRLEDK